MTEPAGFPGPVSPADSSAESPDSGHRDYRSSSDKFADPSSVEASRAAGEEAIHAQVFGPDVSQAEVFEAEVVDQAGQGTSPGDPCTLAVARPRRRRLPLILFGLTCLSLIWAGIWRWSPSGTLEFFLFGVLGLGDTGEDWGLRLRRLVLRNGPSAVQYMFALLAILLTHEMGHFLMSLRYRVAASWPYFLPLPISPIGTLGAVIGMDGRSADRKQIFDIGLAGPLAGLVVAIPVLWIGVQQLDLTVPASGPYYLELPLALRWVVASRLPEGVAFDGKVFHSQLNAFFMAGWVGLLVTGLNMLPVSQLDGGHVIYGLFGRQSRWIARAFFAAALVFIVWAELYTWAIMLALILLMGPDHPPTRDDSVRLGPLRTIIGWLSLAIPILCFPPRPFGQ
jgi:Zn-dependent protease